MLSFWCLLALAFTVPLAIIAAPPSNWSQQLDAFISALIECEQLPGLAINIVYQNKSVYTKGFGVTSLEEGGFPVDENTLFSIGSTTKAFTSTLIGMLIDEYPSAFPQQWDTKVHQIATDFSFALPEQTKFMSIRDLLSMRSGVSTQGMLMWKNDTRRNIVYEFQHAGPAFEMRQEFLYHNFMVALAGTLAEIVTGETWEDMVQQRILTPLGMSTSTPYIADMISSDNFASPYVIDPNTHQIVPLPNDVNVFFQRIGPAGSMCLTANDSTPWLLLHLNGGFSLQTNTSFISSSRLSETHAASFLESPDLASIGAAAEPTLPFSNVNLGYGFGWMHDRYQGHDVYWHDGHVYGYHTSMSFSPADSLGIFMSLTGKNSWHPEVRLRFFIQNMFMSGLDQFITNPCPYRTSQAASSSASQRGAPHPEPTNTRVKKTIEAKVGKKATEMSAASSIESFNSSIYVGTYTALMYDQLYLTDASTDDRTDSLFSHITSSSTAPINLIMTWQDLTVGLSQLNANWFDCYTSYPNNLTLGAVWSHCIGVPIDSVTGVADGLYWINDQYAPPYFNKTAD